MAVGVQKAWSLTAADNGAADTNLNFAEGQSPASLNNSMRAEMAAIKGWANQITGAKTSGGSANAQTLTSDSVAAISGAYAAGMAFVFKAGYTNSGAATLNVDGVGAKDIRKGGAQAALVANDIVAGGIYFVAYEASGDRFLLLNPETGQVALGATLVALAALSWSSGNALLQFTAADTVSLTLTPSVTSLTLSGVLTASAGSAAAPSIKIGAAQDGFYSTSSGASVGLAVAGTLYYTFSSTFGSFAVPLRVAAGSASAPGLVIRTADTNTGWYSIATGNWGWSSAGVKYVDWSATLAQFTMAVQAPIAIASETSGALTGAACRNKQVHCSGNITLPASGMTDGDVILISPRGTARTITRPAAHTMYIAGVDSATGTTGAYNLVTAKYEGSSIWTLQGAVA